MSNHTVKILSALTVAGAMVLSSSAAVAEEDPVRPPTPWGGTPLQVAPSSAAQLSVVPLATPLAAPPEARLSVWIRPGTNLPPVLQGVPKGVAFAGGRWQVFNPLIGLYCIRPAATSGIYANQAVPVVSVDFSQTVRPPTGAHPVLAAFAQWMPSSPPALASGVPGGPSPGNSSWCDRQISPTPGVTPPGQIPNAPRGSYIDIETYFLPSPPLVWSNAISFSVVVQ